MFLLNNTKGKEINYFEIGKPKGKENNYGDDDAATTGTMGGVQ